MMTTEQTSHLLAACASADNRKPSAPALLMWTKIAQQSGWTYDEAVEAVARHYANSREWIMPSDITRIIAERRAEARRSQPWCGECDDATTRQVPVETPDGERWAPCSRCHPSRVTVAPPELHAANAPSQRELTR